MSAKLLGRIKWSLSRDNDGHRTYQLTMLVETSDPSDGPAIVMNTPGLPLPGAPWIYGNDNDPWAFCYPELTVEPVVDKEPNKYWTTQHTFSTKPIWNCGNESPENPLLEPQKVSGSFVEYTYQTVKDRNGKLIKSSSHEIITGIEKDDARPTVQIEQNVATLDLGTIAQMVQTVNDAPLWGLPARTIKLSRASWSRQYYGQCFVYYTRSFEFDIKYDTWDRKDIVDAGFKVYKGTGSRSDPANFVVHKDENGENTPEKILLDGNGDPLTDPSNPVFLDPVELYDESNFLLLGIPTIL